MGGHGVEALAALDGAHQAAFEHLHDGRGGAAQREGRPDALFGREVGQKVGAGYADGPGAGLEGIAVPEPAGFGDEPGRPFGDEQVARVLGDPRRALADLGAVADLLHPDHIVHVVLRDAGRHAGVGHQMIGDDDHGTRRPGVDEGIAQRTAGVGTGQAGGVAVFVGRGRADEGHVDFQFAGLDGPWPRPVRPQHHRIVHQAVDDGIAQFAADAAGLDAVDGALADEVHDGGGLDVHHGTGREAQALDAQFADGREHLADDHVPFAETVVEGNGHAVLEAAGLDGLGQGGEQLGLAGDDQLLPACRAHGLVCGRGGEGAPERSQHAPVHFLRDLTANTVNAHRTSLRS